MKRYALITASVVGLLVSQIHLFAQNSPLGTWEVTISGRDKGIASMTFSNDFTLSGYGITVKSFGLFTITGTWSLNASGKVVGSYTEELGGQSVSGSFVGKARSGKKLQGNAVASNGSFTFTGIPASETPDMSGQWSGTVKQQGQTVAESYDLTPSSFPSVYVLTGQGPGFTISGAAIVSSRGTVNLFSESDFAAGGSSLASLAGTANLIHGTCKLKGVTSDGIPISVQATR